MKRQAESDLNQATVVAPPTGMCDDSARDLVVLAVPRSVDISVVSKEMARVFSLDGKCALQHCWGVRNVDLLQLLLITDGLSVDAVRTCLGNIGSDIGLCGWNFMDDRRDSRSDALVVFRGGVSGVLMDTKMHKKLVHAATRNSTTLVKIEYLQYLNTFGPVATPVAGAGGSGPVFDDIDMTHSLGSNSKGVVNYIATFASPSSVGVGDFECAVTSTFSTGPVEATLVDFLGVVCVQTDGTLLWHVLLITMDVCSGVEVKECLQQLADRGIVLCKWKDSDLIPELYLIRNKTAIQYCAVRRARLIGEACTTKNPLFFCRGYGHPFAVRRVASSVVTAVDTDCAAGVDAVVAVNGSDGNSSRSGDGADKGKDSRKNKTSKGRSRRRNDNDSDDSDCDVGALSKQSRRVCEFLAAVKTDASTAVLSAELRRVFSVGKRRRCLLISCEYFRENGVVFLHMTVRDYVRLDVVKCLRGLCDGFSLYECDFQNYRSQNYRSQNYHNDVSGASSATVCSVHAVVPGDDVCDSGVMARMNHLMRPGCADGDCGVLLEFDGLRMDADDYTGYSSGSGDEGDDRPGAVVQKDPFVPTPAVPVDCALFGIGDSAAEQIVRELGGLQLQSQCAPSASAVDAVLAADSAVNVAMAALRVPAVREDDYDHRVGSSALAEAAADGGSGDVGMGGGIAADDCVWDNDEMNSLEAACAVRQQQMRLRVQSQARYLAFGSVCPSGGVAMGLLDHENLQRQMAMVEALRREVAATAKENIALRGEVALLKDNTPCVLSAEMGDNELRAHFRALKAAYVQQLDVVARYKQRERETARDEYFWDESAMNDAGLDDMVRSERTVLAMAALAKVCSLFLVLLFGVGLF